MRTCLVWLQFLVGTGCAHIGAKELCVGPGHVASADKRYTVILPDDQLENDRASAAQVLCAERFVGGRVLDRPNGLVVETRTLEDRRRVYELVLARLPREHLLMVGVSPDEAEAIQGFRGIALREFQLIVDGARRLLVWVWRGRGERPPSRKALEMEGLGVIRFHAVMLPVESARWRLLEWRQVVIGRTEEPASCFVSRASGEEWLYKVGRLPLEILPCVHGVSGLEMAPEALRAVAQALGLPARQVGE